ncbi:MAG TPA: hypothetical protein VFZ26_14010 [Gemmatimonadales bacterium]
MERRGAARLLIAAAFALAGAACSRPAAQEGGPRLVVEWSGSDTGRMVAPVHVEWCDTLRLLEIRGVRGDSGVAVAVYPGGPVRADSYPVRPPARADSAPPASAIAIRWFAETAIKGFTGDRGVVVLERADDRVTGYFEAGMRSVTDGMRLELRGTFRDVTVVPMRLGCVPRGAPPPDEPIDSGVD